MNSKRYKKVTMLNDLPDLNQVETMRNENEDKINVEKYIRKDHIPPRTSSVYDLDDDEDDVDYPYDSISVNSFSKNSRTSVSSLERRNRRENYIQPGSSERYLDNTSSYDNQPVENRYMLDRESFINKVLPEKPQERYNTQVLRNQTHSWKMPVNNPMNSMNSMNPMNSMNNPNQMYYEKFMNTQDQDSVNDVLEPIHHEGTGLSCVDVCSHVDSCPVCKKIYSGNETLYLIIIFVLSIFCLILLKQVLDTLNKRY